MNSLRQELDAVKDCGYWGDREDYLILYAWHRDSDLITESNRHVIEKMFDDLVNEQTDEHEEFYAIERMGHWAVGWVEYFLINPNEPRAVKLAEEIRQQLESYPILDDEDYSEREYEDICVCWTDCYSVRDRIHWLRNQCSRWTDCFRELRRAVEGDSQALWDLSDSVDIYELADR